MHINDITALTDKVANDDLFGGKKVLLKAKGLYMSWTGFDARNKADARIFDYDRHDVGGQVRQCTAAGMPIEVELAD